MKTLKKIASFEVNHLVLMPGIYVSRTDDVNGVPLVTYDLRFTAPNLEPVMNTAEIHTIEHLGATFLRNHPVFEKDIIYFGPMGCRTGFYLILKGEHQPEVVHQLLLELVEFGVNFEDEIPGATARDCGNYLDQSLPMAKYQLARYGEHLKQLEDLSFQYKD